MRNIVLIGMPGSGKSTVGKLLAKAWNKLCYDLDDIIEQERGMTIAQIFADKGEAFFRELETDAIKRLAKYENIIIATGGGAVVLEANAEYLKRGGILVFLNRPLEGIIQDIQISNRPMLSGDYNRDILYRLYKDRLPIYRRCADIEIMNDCDLNELVKRIIFKMEGLYDA